jgi:hypothetical protein
MLSPQDIRYGNYILGKGKRIMVIGLLEGVTGDDHNYYSLDDCDGIELTKERLIKMGFTFEVEDVFGFEWYKLGEVGINHYEFTLLGQEMTRMLYVHQVQNLYFDLTHKELNFNQ